MDESSASKCIRKREHGTMCPVCIRTLSFSFVASTVSVVPSQKVGEVVHWHTHTFDKNARNVENCCDQYNLGNFEQLAFRFYLRAVRFFHWAPCIYFSIKLLSLKFRLLFLQFHVPDFTTSLVNFSFLMHAFGKWTTWTLYRSLLDSFDIGVDRF